MKSYLKIGMIGNVKLGCSAGAQDRPEGTVTTLRLKPKVAFRSAKEALPLVNFPKRLILNIRASFRLVLHKEITG